MLYLASCVRAKNPYPQGMHERVSTAACSLLLGEQKALITLLLLSGSREMALPCDPVCCLGPGSKMFYVFRKWLYQLETNCSNTSSCVGDFSLITVRKWVRENSQHAGRKAWDLIKKIFVPE